MSGKSPENEMELRKHSFPQGAQPRPALLWGSAPPCCISLPAAAHSHPAFPGPHVSPASCCRACWIWTLPSPPSGLHPELDGLGGALASSLRFPGLRVKLQRGKLMPERRAAGGCTVQPMHPARGRCCPLQEQRGAEPPAAVFQAVNFIPGYRRSAFA